jgi:hypothetical protein
MATRSVSPVEVPERTSFRYTANLTKEDGTPLTAAQLTTLTLTLYAMDATLTIINSVSDQNILNADRGTVDANGLLTIILTPADNQVLNTTLTVEYHIMLIEATYASGTKASRHEVRLAVRNMGLVP